MKSVVIYDTKFGNTEKVAKGIAKVLKADSFKASDVDVSKLRQYEVFVFGCPTHAWNMSVGMKGLFKRLKGESFKGKGESFKGKGELFKGKRAAAFDTKFNNRFAGSAAKKIEGKLKKLGFEVKMKPVSFFVTGNEGPLAQGEMDKTKAFAALKN